MKSGTRSGYLRVALGIILLGGMVLGDVSRVSADMVCYVKASATPPGTGLSWGAAYPDLQTALGNAACTQIWVAAGTYKPTIGMDRTVSFVLKNGVAVYGGFIGTEVLLDQRNPAVNQTILSGDIGASGNSDNSYHVVVGSGTNNTALLDGFIISGGNANGTGLGSMGAGMFNDRGGPSLMNLIFSNNTANYGGGMAFDHSSPNLKNVIFSNNLATTGGGVYIAFFSMPTFTDVTISNNQAVYGGGMYIEEANATLQNATIRNNFVTQCGGGIQINYGFASLTNITFTGNAAYRGGGVCSVAGSSLSLMNVTFSGNSSSDSGGGIYNDDSSYPTIKNSILYGDSGGEISGPNVTVTYSVVQGGYAGIGNLNVDPLLKPLGNYGGFTQTMALKPGSPAIDKGTNSGCPATDQRGVARPKGPRCDMGAYEFPQKTLNLSSRAAEDGWVRESGENTGIGGGSPDAASALLLAGDLSQKSQILSILSFDTAGLPDNAVITSVKVMVKKSGQVGPVDPFSILGNLLLDIKKGVFNDNPSLQVTDFQAAASKNVAVTIKNTPVSGWYTGTLGDANFQYINKTGMTQFRLRFTKDDNNDLAANELKLWSGNAVTAADRPKLIITYYIP